MFEKKNCALIFCDLTMTLMLSSFLYKKKWWTLIRPVYTLILIGGDTGQQPGSEEWGGGGGHLRGDRVPRGGPTDSTEVSPPLMYWHSLINPRLWYIFTYLL